MITTPFKFAIISDPHVALPHTIWHNLARFHQVEVSIPVLEMILSHLEQVNLDFLLLPGDLTQHGEPDNHQWLSDRLSKLPFPVYVIPGNHDVPVKLADHQSIGWADFPSFYRNFGYQHTDKLYYTCELLSGVRLIALNSNQFNDDGKQIGCLDDEQIAWLQEVLSNIQDELVLVTIHHNVLEHLPGQSQHSLGKRYMLDNAKLLISLLKKAGVRLIFTGHLHIQDITETEGMYEITTGSLVSYPHPYRIIELKQDQRGKNWLDVSSYHVQSIPENPNLAHYSREWIGDRNLPFTMQLLTESPLNLSVAEAEKLAPNLRYFWADICRGDALFDFSHLPPKVQNYFERFSAIDQEGKLQLIDNFTTLLL
jgi:3',5'-cyclic AMP phosphodiesterase CpdA